MITFHNVSKSYRAGEGRNYVLRNFSGELPQKNIGILGAKGSGKSTFLRLVSGQMLPDSGSITRRGRISWPLGFAGILNRMMSGAENTRFIARIYDEDPEEVMEFVEEFSELGTAFRMPVSSYSPSMRAKLAFSASMAIAFDTYLIDEIAAAGDAQFRAKCFRMFEERLEKSSIIMVSHAVRTIRDYCETGGIIAGGELVLYDDLRDAVVAYRNMQEVEEMEAGED